MTNRWVALVAVASWGCLGELPREEAGAGQGEMVVAELVVQGSITVLDEPLPRTERRRELAAMQAALAARDLPEGFLFEPANLQLVSHHGWDGGLDFGYAGHLVGVVPKKAFDRDGVLEVVAYVPADPRPAAVLATGCGAYALDGSLEIDTSQPGCDPSRLGVTYLTVRLLPPVDLRPDYGALRRDGAIKAAVIVGLDARNHLGVVQWLRLGGFMPVKQTVGRRWRRNVGSLQEIVDVYSPDDADLLTHEALLAMVRADHEIVLFHGHGFSTNAPSLETPVPDALAYQVIFMDTCWSDQQYGAAVEQGVRTASRLPRVDFVWSVGDATSDNIAPLTQIVLGRLLEGAELHPAPATPGWASIVGAVNEHVERNAREHLWPSWTHFGMTRYER